MSTLQFIITMAAPFGYLYIFTQLLNALLPSTWFPRSYIRRQVFRSLFLVPVLDILARVWLVLPFLPLVAFSFVFNAAVSIGAWYMSSTLSQMANRFFGLMSNYQEAGKNIGSSLLPIARSPLWHAVVTNITNIFSNAGSRLGTVFADQAEMVTVTQAKWNQNNTELFYNSFVNLTSQPVVQEVGANISEVITKAIDTLRLNDMLPNADLTPQSQYKFLTLTTALSQVINSLSVKQLLTNKTHVETLKAAMQGVKEATVDLQESLHLSSQDIIGNQTLSSGGSAALGEIVRLIEGRSSFKEAARSSWESMEFSNVWKHGGLFGGSMVKPIWVMRIVTVLVFLCALVVPLLLLLRVALQLWLQWFVTKYYAKEVEEGRRNMSGWVMTGGIVGAGFGTMQACYAGAALSFAPVSAQGRVAVVVHTCVLVIAYGVGMAAISSAEGRREVIENWTGQRKWWIRVCAFLTLFKIWWDWQLAMMLVSDFLRIDAAVTMFMGLDLCVSLGLRWYLQQVVDSAKKEEEAHLKRD